MVMVHAAARHEEGRYKLKPKYPIGFIVRKGLLLVPNDDVGMARSTVFREVRPESGFKNRRFRLPKFFGGAGVTVGRLINRCFLA